MNSKGPLTISCPHHFAGASAVSWGWPVGITKTAASV